MIPLKKSRIKLVHFYKFLDAILSTHRSFQYNSSVELE
jgi:hypothetical protein